MYLLDLIDVDYTRVNQELIIEIIIKFWITLKIYKALYVWLLIT